MTREVGGALTARSALALGVTMALLGACGGSKASGSASTASDAPTRLKVDCPPRPAQVRPDSQATLTIELKSDPPLAADADVSLRLFEETTQSTHKLSPAAPNPFALRAGVYVLRVTTKGYRSVEAQANLTPGCELAVTMDLRAK